VKQWVTASHNNNNDADGPGVVPSGVAHRMRSIRLPS